MNKIGGKSNTGEGGEEPERFNPLPDGDHEPATVGHQAGRLGTFRRDNRIPGQLRHDPD
jgi:glutamate synthase domain-containing protein 2